MKKFIILLGLLYGCVAHAQFDYPPAPPALANITAAEYFIDTDPGFGAATPITITAANNIPALIASVNLTGVTPGVHQLRVRTRDANGYWSITASQTFENLQPLYSNGSTLVNITAAEYFIDTDPGVGAATNIPVSPAANINNLLVSIDLTGTGTPGNKLLFVRSMDANGKWSISNTTQFNNAVYIYPPAATASGNITAMEYYIDTDPGFGNATPITVPGNTGDVNNYAVNLNLSGSLSVGFHYLYIRSKQNPWSLTTIVPFSASTTLPLTWLYVKGQMQSGNTSLISWGTASESNTRYFEIEHSTDGSAFLKAGTVNAAGNSSVALYYSFTHTDMPAGMNFYRIKQVDLDGRFTYSAVITLLNRNGQTQTLIAPNPVENLLTIVEPEVRFTKSLEIFDGKGALVFVKQIQNKQQVISLPVQHLASGFYVLRINYDGSSKSFQLIKK
jgi:hypothetical protein